MSRQGTAGVSRRGVSGELRVQEARARDPVGTHVLAIFLYSARARSTFSAAALTAAGPALRFLANISCAQE